MTTKKTARKPAAKRTTTAKGRAPLLGAHPVSAAKTATPAKKEPRRTMVGAGVAMIRVGRANAEVLEMVKLEFKLPGHHSFYARWYRSWRVQKGLVTKAFARAHSRSPARAAAKP
jgi:hypothetical protein